MKTAEKLAAGWLLTLGFTFLTASVSAVVERNTMFQPISTGENEELVQEYINKERASLLNATATQGLIFGLPTMILGSWLAWGLYVQSKNDKKALQQQLSDRLQSTFYQMIIENQGRITVLGFAMQSQLPATVARQYLDNKAKEFNANFKVSEEGSVSYHFDV
ncbi:hypothetical protein Nos7524_1482 [Nostoc sp. PCC 7524]|jgi:hypothetical protein|uniref:hypothetical protein n=1 Tax=Nostoc sp. (strain ATCC 29411 / PCC 7524) TaxID=28072 RepID=UPI00029F3970|nr:hypothetical protein [Nostoc sp. PCC 7524]AFY47358.1 hypothetical protein Nos7524_1482 [Nostoc sp. PCC 7524]